MYMGDPSILRNRIWIHQLYTAIFFVSLVLLYALQWGNKIYRFLMFVIVVINLFILWYVFFKNNIGLNTGQFFTLFGLLLLALAITYITHWIRYIFMSIIGIGIVFVLLTGILPLYENMPSSHDFISSQKVKIINQWILNDWIITIKNALGTKQIPVNTLKENDINVSQPTQISFATKTQTDTGQIFIDMGNGSFIHVDPQSAITLEQSWNSVVMEILQGNIEYYIPPEFSWAFQLIGKYTGKNIQDIQNNIRWNLVNQFEQKKSEYFINQIGGSMVLNPTVNRVISFFINTLYKISPQTYQKNLDNYNNIQKYFGTATWLNTPTITWENIQNILHDIMSQVKKWAGETTIIKQLLPK